MLRPLPSLCCVALTAASLLFVACGEDEDAADKLGIGAQCSANADCANDQEDGPALSCLTNFKGGYCGVSQCASNADCPGSSACVTHDDGKNYCFRTCAAKADCNANRDAANEANCSARITFADANTSGKACVPPSGS
jgi:hypothetical protein